MRIAITENQKPNLKYYVQWLQRGGERPDVVTISYLADNLHELERCDGLVLTGGGDVDPVRYHRNDVTDQVRGVDPKRDDFEFGAIEKAMKMEIPTLGICRGLQVTNVAFGGSLIVDLESNGLNNHRQPGDDELRHRVEFAPGTILSEIVGRRTADVNSAHHQAADTIGRDLKVSARSTDGVVEGLEWSEPSSRPFLLLVQWHPERMKDFHNPTSKNILDRFLSEVKKAEKSVEV